MAFKVINIIDSNTIQVEGWNWSEEYSGTKVKINELMSGVSDVNFTKSKLEILLKNKEVELINPTEAQKGNTDGDDIVFCSIQLNGINIAEYFPELKQTH